MFNCLVEFNIFEELLKEQVTCKAPHYGRPLDAVEVQGPFSTFGCSEHRNRCLCLVNTEILNVFGVITCTYVYLKLHDFSYSL